jgi:hypothetical protein
MQFHKICGKCRGGGKSQRTFKRCRVDWSHKAPDYYREVYPVGSHVIYRGLPYFVTGFCLDREGGISCGRYAEECGIWLQPPENEAIFVTHTRFKWLEKNPSWVAVPSVVVVSVAVEVGNVSKPLRMLASLASLASVASTRSSTTPNTISLRTREVPKSKRKYYYLNKEAL